MDKQVKVAPNSKESEMMVLGCMLTNPDSLQYGTEELDIADFYYTENQIIFQALKASHKNRKSADIHLICEDLKSQDKLQTIGGISYITTLAQYAGTSAYVEEYIEILKNKSLLRNLIFHSQEIEKQALDDPDNAISLIDKYSQALKQIENRFSKKVPLTDIEERIKQVEDFRNEHVGKKYLGLCVKTINEFNDHLLGLRKLNLLAAAPNVGKTALTIQLALEVLLTEPDACLAYFSLEMSSTEIFTRMNLFLSEMNFQQFIFGTQKNEKNRSGEAFFTQSEYEQINSATATLRQIGNRLQILDSKSCPFIDSRTVVNHVEALKAKTKCTRAIVIIDYLQVWPLNPNLRFMNENETDKWRIGEMKRIRDSMNDDPVIVISEARKPGGKEDLWGGDLSDVMGSARGTYTPDVVMLLLQLRPKALDKIWEKNNLPKIKISDEFEGDEKEKHGLAIKDLLAKNGIAICKLEIPKARDGMQKFSLFLEFHFHKNTFKKVDWSTLRELSRKEDPKRSLNFS